MVEGTVSSLLADCSGNVVGVSYRDKQAGCAQVSLLISCYLARLKQWCMVFQGRLVFLSGPVSPCPGNAS